MFCLDIGMNWDQDEDYSDGEVAANEEWEDLMSEIDHNDDDLDDGQIQQKIIDFLRSDKRNLRAFYDKWTPMWYALSYQRWNTNPEQWPTIVIAYLVKHGITRPTAQEERDFFHPQDGAPPLSPPDSPRYRSPSPDPPGWDAGRQTPPPRSPGPFGEPYTETVTLITNSIMNDISIR
jgi:hypothetical protein